MKIQSLVEDISKGALKSVHGLSLYIETVHHRILFDVGPDSTLFENAKRTGIDISAIDTVIISHGHRDHGGALKEFLSVNSKAKIYVQKKAFETHTSHHDGHVKDISLDQTLALHPQVILLNGNYRIDEELALFVVTSEEKCHSSANDVLYAGDSIDDFSHEQNLLITEKETSLIMGCGHKGIVNIMEYASRFNPTLCVGGFHLIDPSEKKTVPAALLNAIADELAKYPDIRYYTCHCTGREAYDVLSERLTNFNYLYCGDTIQID